MSVDILTTRNTGWAQMGCGGIDAKGMSPKDDVNIKGK